MGIEGASADDEPPVAFVGVVATPEPAAAVVAVLLDVGPESLSLGVAESWDLLRLDGRHGSYLEYGLCCRGGVTTAGPDAYCSQVDTGVNQGVNQVSQMTG